MRKILFKSVLVASAMFGTVVSASVAQAGDIKNVFEGDVVVFGKSFDNKGIVQAVRFEKLPVEDDASSNSKEPTGMPFLLKMKFKDSKKTFEAFGSCFADAEVMDCRIGCDDSGFTLKLEEDQSVSLINTQGFQLNGCLKDKDAEVRKFEVDGDDPVYTLGKAKQG